MKKLALFALSVALAACGEAPSDLLVFDVERAIDTKQQFDLSAIVDDCEFTPLDGTLQEAILGNFLRVGESKERFYITDDNRKPLKVFSKSGEFLSTIGRVGRGPDEVTGIGGFAVDGVRDNVYIKGGTRILAYDTEGNLIARTDSIANEGLVTAGKIVWRDDELFVLSGSSSGEPLHNGKRILFKIFTSDIKQEAVIEVADKGSTESIVLPFAGTTIEMYPESGVVYDNGKSLYVKEILSDTVFVVGGDRMLVPAYRIDVGRHFIPAEAYGPSPELFWNNAYHMIVDIQAGDRYLILQIATLGDESFLSEYLILDRDNPTEGFTATGPEGQSGLFFDGIEFKPCYIRDNRLVGYIQAIDIVDNASGITNPDLKALAATLKEDSNPVIVSATLKK